MAAPATVDATPEAMALIGMLKDRHGPLAFYHRHGCNEGGPAPVCFPKAEYRPAPGDLCLGEICACPVYASGPLYDQWRGVLAIIDVAPGLGAGFSLEATEGVSFFTRLRPGRDAEPGTKRDATA